MKEYRASIGLPVYNGEKFLPEALDSLLAQTFIDFEVVISDNASTDRTREICCTYAARDSRIRYFRNEANRGVAWNHNNVFSLSRGKYFQWIGHDDVLAPQYLERCITILDQDPSIILCYSRSKRLDENGQFFDDKHDHLATDSAKPLIRFRDLVCIEHSSLAMFGVMRAEVLKKTVLLGYYPSGDRVLLAQLGLFGRFHQIPEPLFFRRVHPGQSTNLRRHIRALQFDPKRSGFFVLPRWEMFGGYFSCISKAPISRYEQLQCYILAIKAIKLWWREMRDDVLVAIKQILLPSSSKG
ncbi:MAG: glycosyltransferase family 2 protein [Candidatus Binatia bacterium]